MLRELADELECNIVDAQKEGELDSKGSGTRPERLEWNVSRGTSPAKKRVVRGAKM